MEGSLCNVEIIVSRGRAVKSLSLLAVGAILPSVAVIAVILGITLTIPMVGTTRTVPVAAAFTVIVTAITVPTVVFPRGVFPGAATRGWRASATGRTSGATTIAVATGLESPRGRGRSASPLNFQEVVTAHALVMHLMVGIVSVPSIFILDKGKESARS
jgi:hypothetical protein